MTQSRPATRRRLNPPFDHPDRGREQARLGCIWEHLGFRHYLESVLVCDPAAGELDDGLDELTKVVLG